MARTEPRIDSTLVGTIRGFLLTTRDGLTVDLGKCYPPKSQIDPSSYTSSVLIFAAPLVVSDSAFSSVLGITGKGMYTSPSAAKTSKAVRSTRIVRASFPLRRGTLAF